MENGGGEDELDLRGIRALLKVVRADVAKHEEALFGGRRGSGLVRVGEETRSGVMEMRRQYLNDRAWVLRQAKAWAPVARRAAYAVLMVLLLSAVTMTLVLWRLSGS